MTQTATTTVPDIRPNPSFRKKRAYRRQPRYHVVLWNDNDHTYQYVVSMLQKLFGHPSPTGIKMATEVDQKGESYRSYYNTGTRRIQTRPNPCFWC